MNYFLVLYSVIIIFYPAKSMGNSVCNKTKSCIMDFGDQKFTVEGSAYDIIKTLYAIRKEKIERTIESVHRDLPIREIIDRTWKPKELFPAVDAPRMGGTLSFWRSSLLSLQMVLDAFARDLQENELRFQAYPHRISGIMDLQQRIEFLAFHIDRHKKQVTGIISSFSE